MQQHQQSTKCKAKYADVLLRKLEEAGIDHSQLSQLKSPLTAPTVPTCPGTRFLWPLDSVYHTYPFSIHDPSSTSKPGYTILAVDSDTKEILIRSDLCSQESPSATVPCIECQSAKELAQIVCNRANRAPGRLDLTILSYHQLVQKLEALKDTVKEHECKIFNANKSLNRLRSHQDSWEKVLELVGTHDVPALHRIFRNAKSMGWTTEKLLEKIKMALDGKYHAKNFSQLEIDLAITVYELGGGAALHALHNSPFAFPCYSSLAAHKQEYHLRISCGSPRMTDILANIETMFRNTDANHTRVGVTLSMDEIACDGRLCYLSENDEIVGLCEHSNKLDSRRMGSDLENVKKIALAVRDEEVHVAHEVFVAAFSRNDSENYSARPVLLLPTCKQSSYEDSALLIEMLRQAWAYSPFGERLHGPIWSIASDGEPKRRPALYLHCMVRGLQPIDPLFQYVGNLPGLNIITGSNGETHDFDYKHTFKRICKLLCTREGILVNGVIIHKTILASWLEELNDVDWSGGNSIYHLLNPGSSIHERIQSLLSPKDLQDVPRAVKLLSLVSNLRDLDQNNMNPSKQRIHHALSLLGEMLEALLEPFINPELSLSQQITSLIKFAHISCALFRKHRGVFMPEHLYSDLQCMVRTAIFRVAQTKVLDPSGKVYLCLLGDDVLEVFFGRIRMIGGHSPNVDIDELRLRAGSATLLDNIFCRYPHWERRSVRLKLNRSRDIDHLSPRNWIGDLSASACDLSTCWSDGVGQAETFLAKHGVHINFGELFHNWHSTGVDLFRPDGGKYPGISTEVDRSLVESGSSPSGNIQLEGDHAFKSFDIHHAIKNEQELAAMQTFDSTWIRLQDGSLGHKKTILRIFMDRAGDIDYAKSHDRLLRVRYFSIGGDSLDRSTTHVYHSNASGIMFKLEDLFVAPICVNSNSVALAVLQCTAIKSGLQHFDRAPTSEIILPDSSYEVAGQILSLFPYQRDSELFWAWDLQFVAIDTPKARGHHLSLARLHHLNIPLHGSLVHPIPHQFLSLIEVSMLSEDSIIAEGTADKTWLISDKIMNQMFTNLILRLQQDEYKDAQPKIPIYGQVKLGLFPYQTVDTSRVYITTTIPVPHLSTALQSCLACNHKVAGPDRQNHMGRHILRRFRGVRETGVDPGLISLIYPCGFCGESCANGKCEVGISHGNATSTCTQAYSFRIGAASKVSKTKLCTNVPIQCIFCAGRVYHWKYNMYMHLQERHPDWRTLEVPGNKCFASFLSDITITEKEEEELGIPAEKQGLWAVMRASMYDLGRQNHIPDTRNQSIVSPRRPGTYHRIHSTPNLVVPIP